MTITTFLSRMAIAGAFIAVFALSMPTPAEANWLSHTWHKAKHAAHHAGNTIKHGAKKTGSAIKHGAEETGRAIEHGAEAGINEMKKLSGQLTQITGTCETAIDKVGHKVSSAMPTVAVAALPQLSSSRCEINQTSGFMCGIVPYANVIVKAIAEGAHDMKALANHVGRAYHSHACSHFSTIDPNRGMCALFVGMAEETKQSVQCVIDVARKMAAERGARHSFNETKICHFIGEFGFGFLADRLALAGVAEEKRKLLKLAQLLRTALALKGTAANSVKNISSCREARR